MSSPTIGMQTASSPSSSLSSSSSSSSTRTSLPFRYGLLLLLAFSLCSVCTVIFGFSRYLITPYETSLPPSKPLRRDHHSNAQLLPSSPACRPHFQVALPDGQWTCAKKFTRLYFYHVRKAGGTTLRRYFEKVAAHHGLEYEAVEFFHAEDPSSHHDHDDEATFYVTHLREPVARSISHFKYEGRWDCDNLINNKSYVPTEANAAKLETWNQTHGHHPASCLRIQKFAMAECAVNCYSQWFSGSCPTKANPEEVPMTQQYSIAKDKLLRYNMIVITEMLQHANYVDAVERFFGVPGLIPKRDVHPWCEVESHYANEMVPLVIQNETLDTLTELNEIDIGLYHEIRDCLDDDEMNDFPSWDDNRFETNETIQVDHDVWERQNPIKGYQKPLKKWLEKFESNNAHDSGSSSPGSVELVTPAPPSSLSNDAEIATLASPACEPHFRVALPDGSWTEASKFTRLYFYHSRKAGGTNMKRYFQKVAAHHGLEFASDEFTAAEDPGSADETTFYVTHLREPVARSLSHFKYEGRWNCKQLLHNDSFVPTEENAATLEAWSNHYGDNNNRPNLCVGSGQPDKKIFFHMVKCGCECYLQWIAGLSCPLLNPPEEPGERIVPLTEQFHVAKAKLLRYNFIAISEMLQNEEYVAAVERFFGVPGISQRKYSPWCEAESHYTNKLYPLVIEPEVLNNLTMRNRLDIRLYNDIKNCLDETTEFRFPAWRGNRFDTNETIQIDYNIWEENAKPYWPTTPKKEWLEKFNNTALVRV